MQGGGDNYRRIRDELPPEVTLVVAAKGRSADEVAEVVAAGAAVIGENYVQEAEAVRGELGETARRVEWHLIGHLQSNKVNKALPLFDVIQSMDSERLARAIGRRAQEPVRAYVEVNVGGEGSKSGVPPQEVADFVRRVAVLENIRIEGLMTMEPYCEDAEDARPYFQRMWATFEEIRRLDLPGVRIDVLSMGMTNSYRVAVEEGANMVRIGTAIFGPRRT